MSNVTPIKPGGDPQDKPELLPQHRTHVEQALHYINASSPMIDLLVAQVEQHLPPLKAVDVFEQEMGWQIGTLQKALSTIQDQINTARDALEELF